VVIMVAEVRTAVL